ncbi:MAG: adenosylcobinamide-phosphate synthase CbiB [Pseudomonadota bacterium]
MSMLLLLAHLIDAAFGEPRALWSRIPHPVVLIGRGISGLEERLNRGQNRRAKGVLLVLLLVGLSAIVGMAVAALPGGPVWEVLVAAVLIAHRSLVDHVTAVRDALTQGLAEGRQAVAMIVGRDVTVLDESGVSRAAIESAAENLADGVIAPAFWFLIGGLPGILIYKAVNTADSMIGHRTERFAQIGWAAARLDDLLNLIPARLTALLIALTGDPRRIAPVIWRDARRHRSPNAGWPEAAMAARLGIALSGPRIYAESPSDDPFLNEAGRRDLGTADIAGATGILWQVLGLWLALLVLLSLGGF